MVFAPTCTGLGDKAHLLSKDITLDTFTNDVAGVIEAEELNDVILVGHPFGGNPTSGIAERMPNRIKHLVYLDSLIVPNRASHRSTVCPPMSSPRAKRPPRRRAAA